MQGDRLTLAAVGDCQVTTRHSPCKDPRFLELVKLLRSVDVAYANMEQCIHNFGPECYASFSSGGTYTHSSPFIADEMKWMGFDMVSLATNHALDWMFGGLKETIENLDKVGIAHAGTGLNLGKARSPCFFDSEQGRVALISVDTSKPVAAASASRQDAPGRPGSNPMRVTRHVSLEPKAYEAMKQVMTVLESLGFNLSKKTSDEDEIDFGFEHRFWPVKFTLGDTSKVFSIPVEKDVNEILQMVDDAKRQADWIFVTQHHHLTDGADRDLPSKAVEEFARKCVENGADGYFGTGPHRIQGIEIHHEKPIFYALPDFIQQRDMGKASPQQFYENYGLGFTNTPMDVMDARSMKVTAPPRGSGMVVCTFQKHSVVDIKLYPVDPQADLPRWQMGRPLRANEELSKRIIEHWSKLSDIYGTKIEYEKGIGIVKLP